jgi:hypothetical protein
MRRGEMRRKARSSVKNCLLSFHAIMTVQKRKKTAVIHKYTQRQAAK